MQHFLFTTQHHYITHQTPTSKPLHPSSHSKHRAIKCDVTDVGKKMDLAASFFEARLIQAVAELKVIVLVARGLPAAARPQCGASTATDRIEGNVANVAIVSK
ncbi:hypothetical protein O0L34_g8570 [Tuta absoluta]|nr:hypothetical protein O0L34_g8570 [Tuta absoluta]